jgi:hypothetical protein
MAGVLSKIEPLIPPLVLPLGDDGVRARQVDVTPDGRPVYQMRRIRAKDKKEPVIDPATGEQLWEKHPATAQPLYRRWRLVRDEYDLLFTMENDGQGNTYVQKYTPPSPEEIAAKEQEQQAARFKDDLARLASERGISAEALLARLMDAGSAAEEEDAVEYPENYAPGRWRLSNGKKMQGTKEEALAAEAALSDGIPAH